MVGNIVTLVLIYFAFDYIKLQSLVQIALAHDQYQKDFMTVLLS